MSVGQADTERSRRITLKRKYAVTWACLKAFGDLPDGWQEHLGTVRENVSPNSGALYSKTHVSYRVCI